MNIVVNTKNEITSYATTGSFIGGINYAGKTPEDFESNFTSGRYLLENDVIVLNSDYSEPEIILPDLGPTKEQLMINQLGIQIAQLTAMISELKGG